MGLPVSDVPARLPMAERQLVRAVAAGALDARQESDSIWLVWNPRRPRATRRFDTATGLFWLPNGQPFPDSRLGVRELLFALEAG